VLVGVFLPAGVVFIPVDCVIYELLVEAAVLIRVLGQGLLLRAVRRLVVAEQGFLVQVIQDRLLGDEFVVVDVRFVLVGLELMEQA